MKLGPLSVMIVEQQPMMLTALSTTLSSAGITVLDEVSDGKKALQLVSVRTPNLILFSIGVPSLDDLEAISALRKKMPNTLILALVTGEFSGQENAALDHGADRVLFKTAHRTEILSMVRAMTH